MRPVEVIEKLEQRYVNTDIDWETILEHGYRSFLTKESRVVDIGGHAGRHASVFIEQIRAARVDIIEPLPDHAAALRARYAGTPGVHVHACAMGAEEGRAEFIFNTGSPEESGLRERRYNDPSAARLERLSVEVTTLDRLCADFDRLDFVKIDTEGSEVDILIGGSETLRRLRPTLSIEYGAAAYEAYGKQKTTLYELMDSFDYGLFDLFGNALATPEDWDECVDHYYWDYFAAPRERAGEFSQGLEGQIDRVEASLVGGSR